MQRTDLAAVAKNVGDCTADDDQPTEYFDDRTLENADVLVEADASAVWNNI